MDNDNPNDNPNPDPRCMHTVLDLVSLESSLV